MANPIQETIHGKECTITENNIHIKDSYTVNDKYEMSEILAEIKINHPECKVFDIRKWDNLLSEWKCHNRLYKLGIFKTRTGSVDLDSFEPWWRRVLYAILGI